MINNLKIQNFKSIKELDLPSKRFNLFIGRPNAGKSNILEAVGIFSIPHYDGDIKSFVRLETLNDIFYDHALEEKIKIKTDKDEAEISFDGQYWVTLTCDIGQSTQSGWSRKEYNFEGYPTRGLEPFPTKIKFYRFKVLEKFERTQAQFLYPPSGDNLFALLTSRKELKSLIKNIFDEFGLRVVFKVAEKKIEVMKEIEDIVYTYPYSIVSDTLQRLVFHMVAIETNKDATIIFEEPEAHAFPYYTKYLAERIALDKTNQYFIATHNPYFLSSVLEKAPKKDVQINVVYFKDYQTRVKQLSEKEMVEVMDLNDSVFFNLERFIPE
jgi:hypothetical protein